MRRLIPILLASVFVIGVAPTAATASPDPFKGRWVAVDLDFSTWHITISDDQFHGHDSGTIPGEGARTRTWGEMNPISEFERQATLNLQIMRPGPPHYILDLQPWFLTYQPATDTIIGDQGPIGGQGLIEFCRVPCDPNEFPPQFP